MPRVDRFEVARQLRQHSEFHRIYIVAPTGYDTEQDRRKSLDAGFDDHLVKPPAIETLQKLLARVTPEGGGK